jgi:hypothetical protein
MTSLATLPVGWSWNTALVPYKNRKKKEERKARFYHKETIFVLAVSRLKTIKVRIIQNTDEERCWAPQM